MQQRFEQRHRHRILHRHRRKRILRQRDRLSAADEAAQNGIDHTGRTGFFQPLDGLRPEVDRRRFRRVQIQQLIDAAAQHTQHRQIELLRRPFGMRCNAGIQRDHALQRSAEDPPAERAVLRGDLRRIHERLRQSEIGIAFRFDRADQRPHTEQASIQPDHLRLPRIMSRRKRFSRETATAAT